MPQIWVMSENILLETVIAITWGNILQYLSKFGDIGTYLGETVLAGKGTSFVKVEICLLQNSPEWKTFQIRNPPMWIFYTI